VPEMRKAFTEISRRAYSAVTGSDAIPPEYAAQQQELNAMMSLMNTEFGRLLKFYALRHAHDALSDTEELERARLTQLTFNGLTLELTTVELGASLERRLQRSVWSTSLLFNEICTDAEQVEEQLVSMFMEEQSP
jgi:hypothetical protein